MAANPCIRFRHGQAVMPRLTPTRALIILLPGSRISDFGVHAEVSREFLSGTAFQFHHGKQPAAISPYDAMVGSHATHLALK